MNILEALKEVAIEHLKPVLKPLAKAIAEKIVFPVLEAEAKKTSTPIDDIVLSAVKEKSLEALDKLEI